MNFTMKYRVLALRLITNPLQIPSNTSKYLIELQLAAEGHVNAPSTHS